MIGGSLIEGATNKGFTVLALSNMEFYMIKSFFIVRFTIHNTFQIKRHNITMVSYERIMIHYCSNSIMNLLNFQFKMVVHLYWGFNIKFC